MISKNFSCFFLFFLVCFFSSNSFAAFSGDWQEKNFVCSDEQTISEKILNSISPPTMEEACSLFEGGEEKIWDLMRGDNYCLHLYDKKTKKKEYFLVTANMPDRKLYMVRWRDYLQYSLEYWRNNFWGEIPMNPKGIIVFQELWGAPPVPGERLNTMMTIGAYCTCWHHPGDLEDLKRGMGGITTLPPMYPPPPPPKKVVGLPFLAPLLFK